MKSFGFSGKHTVRGRMTEDFNVVETLYPAMLKQPRHTHLLASFSFISSGTYLEDFGRKTFAREASTVVFHPPHESHSVKYQSPVSILSVHFSFEKLAHIREHSDVLDMPSSCRTQTALWLGIKLGQELRRTDAASLLVTEGLVLEMLGEASRKKIRGSEKDFPRWLKDARDFLHENFNESSSLADVARIAGVHPAHLSRVFRQTFGCTVGEYWRRLRLEYACGQIVKTDKRLSEVATDAGFSDQSHLNRIFKETLNMTPHEYRKLLRSR